MNLCKSAGGGISARTKSLREKFSSKRSYSELSFKDASSTSTSSLVCESIGPSRVGSTRRTRSSNVPSIFEQGRQASADSLRITSIPGGNFNSFNLMPEDAYCSALDVNCQDGEPRFPWQRDVAIQCDLVKAGPVRTHSMRNGAQTHSPKRSSSHLHADTQNDHKDSHKKTSAFSGLRFWKSSSPLPDSGDDKKAAQPKPVSTPKPSHPKSALHRAVSFDSRGYSRLVQQSSETSLCSSPTLAPTSSHLYVPQHHQTLTSSPEVQSPNSEPRDNAPCLYPTHLISAPQSRIHSPPGSRSTDQYARDSDGKAMRDQRKLCVLRKQPSSAPDSFDDGSPPDSPTNARQAHAANVFTFDTMQKLFDLKIRAKANETRNELPMQKPMLLDIPTASGLTSGHSNKGVHGYMNLPSPNVQNEQGQDANPVFKKLTGQGDESEQEEPDQEASEPPASVLHRRRALVPPKLITDGYESANDEMDNTSSSTHRSPHRLCEPSSSSKTRRRSSIVVIPPMQICPGDLLVYSKVLTNRNNLFENLEGSTQCLAGDDASRKGKNTWSLLRLFDRSNRGKSDSLCGLEEVLSSLTPSVFVDEQLARYKGLTWYDFLSQFEDRRASSIVSGHRLSQPTSESRRSSGLSSLTVSSGNAPPLPRRPTLLRTQTFDSPQTEPADDTLVVAHSTRSHSCIAPVDVNIRRLSGNVNLAEEPALDADGQVIGQTSDAILSPPIIPDSVCSSARSSFAISRSEQKRREALWDLFQSETVFMYDHLMILKNVFMEPLKKIQVEGFAMFAEPEVLFGNLDELCCVTYAFCKEFLNVILHQMGTGELNATEVLVRLFQKSNKAATLTQAYHRYTLNYINALNYLETLRRQLEFNEFEKWCSRDQRCKKLQLTDLLVSPVQHIMRVPLILKDIETRTEDLGEREIITNIIETEETHLRELDDKMKWLKNFERLLEIQRNILWPSVCDLDPKVFIPEFLKGPLSKQPCERLIVSPRRQIILEGPLNLLDSGKPVEMHLILFDDMFVITRRKKGLNKKQSSLTEKWASSCGKGTPTSSHEGLFKYVVYKQPLSLDRFYIHEVTPTEVGATAANNLKFVFVLVCLNRFQQIVTCHTFQAPNDSVKIMWLTKLRDTADKWKRTLQNTVFRNQQRLSSASVSTTASLQPPPPGFGQGFNAPHGRSASQVRTPSIGVSMATSMHSLQVK